MTSLQIQTETVKKYAIVIAYFSILSYAYQAAEQHGLFNLVIYTFDFEAERLMLSAATLFFIAQILPGKTHRVSDYFLWLHAAFPVIPSLVFFSYSGGNLAFLTLVVLSFTLIRLLTIRSLRLPRIRLSIGSPEWILWPGIFLLFAVIILGGDYSGITYSLKTLYTVRAEINEMQSGYFNYLHTNLSKSLLPFMLVYYYMRRNTLMFLVTFLCSISVFFLSLHRAALFFPLLALICYEAASRSHATGGIRLLGMLCVLLVVSVLLLSNSTTVILGDLAIRRTFIVPAALNYEYFRFFQDNPFTFFSDSKITFGLLPFRYSESVPFIMGYQIGAPGAHANASYLGSGYQQAGIIGVMLYAVIIASTLRILDGLGRLSGSHSFIFAVCAAPLFWLINSSDLPSVYLTHGLLLSMLICWVTAPYLKHHLFARDSAIQVPSSNPSNPPAAR